MDKAAMKAAHCPEDCANKILAHPNAAAVAPFWSLLLDIATSVGPQLAQAVWAKVLAWLNQQPAPAP